ncbi:MAG TPA: acyl-CoA thioesterase [Elusimicrobia bacterium]|nr:acyl-CoA thioesterase [Elusimicrobiota bacterium]
MEIKIYYQDTDCGGLVYYANYLTYFERARTEWFLEKDISVKQLAEQGILFVVAHAELDYKSPARYGETIIIQTQLESAAGTRLELSYRIEEKETKRMLVTGKTTLVCVNSNLKPQRIADDIIGKLKL